MENNGKTPCDAETGKAEESYCLLVDDIQANLQILDFMMRRLKYKTILVNSAVEALKLMESNNVSMVLTDIWMPEMDGAEFA